MKENGGTGFQPVRTHRLKTGATKELFGAEVAFFLFTFAL
jgi:hypothetical protein